MSIDQYNIENENFKNDEISLKELIFLFKKWFIYLKSKWKIILITGIIGASIGMLIAYINQPIYKAELTFAMEDDNGTGAPGLSGALGLASSFGIDLGGSSGGGAFAASNLAELMKSRLIVEKVLLDSISIEGNKTTLAEYYIKINKLRESWEQKPELDSIHFLPNLDRNIFSIYQNFILKQIHQNLIDKENLIITQKDKKVTILSITVKSKDELFSKLFCENLAKKTSEFYIETKSKKARINANVLQRQVDSIRSELNGSIVGVASEIDHVYNLNPAFNIKGTPSKKKQIDVQSNTAILTNLTVQLELAKITLRKETPLIQLIDRPILPLEKEKLGRIKTSLLGFLIAIIITTFYLIFKQSLKKIDRN